MSGLIRAFSASFSTHELNTSTSTCTEGHTWLRTSDKNAALSSITKLENSKSIPLGRHPRKSTPHFHLHRPATPRRINHLTNLKPVKLARRTHGVRAHIVEPEPVANLERAGQLRRGADAVDRVARGAPDAAGVQRASLTGLRLVR